MPVRCGAVKMRTPLAVLLAAIAALSVAGCESHGSANPSAPAGGAPPIPTAVGPVPGGGQAPAYRADPYAGNPVALQEGRKLFVWYNCSGCHGGHGGGGMGPSLRDATWIYGDRDDQIFDSIAAGRGKGMPAWGTKVPDDQIWKLVAYIKSLRTPQEPEPPIVPSHEQVAPPSIIQPSKAAHSSPAE